MIKIKFAERQLRYYSDWKAASDQFIILFEDRMSV